MGANSAAIYLNTYILDDTTDSIKSIMLYKASLIADFLLLSRGVLVIAMSPYPRAATTTVICKVILLRSKFFDINKGHQSGKLISDAPLRFPITIKSIAKGIGQNLCKVNPPTVP